MEFCRFGNGTGNGIGEGTSGVIEIADIGDLPKPGLNEVGCETAKEGAVTITGGGRTTGTTLGTNDKALRLGLPVEEAVDLLSLRGL